MEEKKELWMVQTKRADFSGLAMQLGVSPVAVRVMRNRGLTEEAEMRKYLYGTLDDLYDPRLMKGMEQAAELIARKLKEGKHVRIIGDYDIDGVCSTYILLKGFQRAAKELSQRCSLEAGRYSVEKENDAQIDYEIPDRIKDGYGINESIIRQASADGVDTLVTCDNGIAALREISIAKQLGMTVVVTDHHEVPVRSCLRRTLWSIRSRTGRLTRSTRSAALWSPGSASGCCMRSLGSRRVSGWTCWNSPPSLRWGMS